MSDGARYSPEGLVEAIQMISRSIDGASLDTLERAHAVLEVRFFEVIESGSLDNAAEQRILGILWAEIEVEIDKRRKKA